MFKNIHGREWPVKPINYIYMQQRGDNQKGDFQSLFEIAAKRMGIGTEFHAIRICNDARQLLEKWLPEYEQEYRVASYRTGCLTISSKSPAVSQHIQMKSHDLRKELNKKLGGNTVSRIRIKSN